MIGPDGWYLHAGDNRELMANMADNTVDAVVTDGPYELVSIRKRFGGDNAAPQQFGTDGAYARAARGFMGQTWDGTGIVNDPTFWAEVLRVLKPGGHLLSFGGSRTYHRMACAVEDAGFEIRDMLEWLYGSGFPKSHAVDKAITALERTGGSTPRDLRRARLGDAYAPAGLDDPNGVGFDAKKLGRGDDGIATALSPLAEPWAGWGSALKPGHEPICMARKPFAGSIAANVLAWGTGALNIDGCRVEGEKPDTTRGVGGQRGRYGPVGAQGRIVDDGRGRFPANVAHDGSDEVLAGFPAEAGARAPVHTRGGGNIDEAGSTFHGDQGSAARFFYCAKASKRDRDEGCEHLPVVAAGMTSENSGQHITRRGEDDVAPQRANHHPTVKPTDVMRWLVRMVTPPGGIVFDPFTGSGSTGKAAMLEGFRFLGAEMTPEYLPIARARIDHAVNCRLLAEFEGRTE